MPPHLIQLRHGKPVDRFELREGRQSIGRHEDNEVVIADESISRQHAELVVSDGATTLTDLGSRNGVLVNNVPRKHATLHEGDRVQLGAVQLNFSAGPPSGGPPAPGLALEPQNRQQQTRRQAIRLPDARPERHLAAFYRLCAWVTEGVEEENGLPHWLELLVESLRAHTVHFYAPDFRLAHAFHAEEPKPRVKFASYLLERFAALPEATAYAPRELDRYQQRLGNFHYLIAPLRPPPQTSAPVVAAARCPVVALLRPAEWEPFSTEDRVLVQGACQLWLRSVRRAAEVTHLREENTELRRQVATSKPPADGLLGDSPALAKLRAQIARTAATKATVLITGETGSGKEIVAGALHHYSPRAQQPFVKVNCGAIPGGLIESELFGHVKGAFTDARTDREGKFARADRGTLFLDEIGELPLSAQTRLLRVLEEGVVEPLGCDRPQKIDVRVVAATNRNLTSEVAAGRFRQDLFYRLNVVSLAVPPLRDHLDDLPALAAHFLVNFCAENGLAELTLAPAALTVLKKQSWPGNVRELRNIIQRLAIEAGGPIITPDDIRKLD